MENGCATIISGIRPMYTGISSSTHGRLKSTVMHAWILNCISLYGLRAIATKYMRSNHIQSQFYTV